MRLGALAMFSLASPALAGEFSLNSPIDCAVGEDQPCYIQQYMDHDPGPGSRDFTCHDLSYDGHGGTDFALTTLEQLDENVRVLAAADGIVTRTRNDMIDKLYTPAEDARIDGRKCGNGVVIQHAGGWESQYCHLKQGSIAVKPGDNVRTGDTLGYVGLSGNTQFPHLHLDVRHAGRDIDPFSPGNPASCALEASDSLWSTEYEYRPAGLISTGFWPGVPDYAAIKQGSADAPELPVTSPAMVLWGFTFGTRAGDVMHFTVTDPAGKIVHTTQVDIEKSQAQGFRATGRKTNGKAWFRPGTYTGTVTLERDGRVISDQIVTTTVTSP